MRKLILITMTLALLLLPLVGQDDVGYTKDYIDAMQKPAGNARIAALKAYVTKYPDTTGQFTRLAYYWLALDYFQVKNYGECIKRGEARLKMGNFGPGEEARLTLVLANCYGITGDPNFNKEKALQHVNKAIKLGNTANDKQVVSTAQTLKKSLSGPAPKKLTPEQKIKQAYGMESFGEAISIYRGMSAADKGNPEILKIYANSLLKTKKYDSALAEFQKLYGIDKKAAHAKKIADIYNRKAARNKALYDQAAEWYVRSGFLYENEGSASNKKIAFQKAFVALATKHGFEKQRKALERKQKANRASASRNAELIKKKKRDLRKLQRQIQREYEMQGYQAPQWLTDKVTQTQKEIAALQAGGSTSDLDAAKKLQDLRKTIEKELEALKTKVKKTL